MSGRKISLFIPLSSGAENASTWCSSPAPRKLDLQKTNTLGAVEIFMMVNKKKAKGFRDKLFASAAWAKNDLKIPRSTASFMSGYGGTEWKWKNRISPKSRVIETIAQLHMIERNFTMSEAIHWLSRPENTWRAIVVLDRRIISNFHIAPRHRRPIMIFPLFKLFSFTAVCLDVVCEAHWSESASTTQMEIPHQCLSGVVFTLKMSSQTPAIRLVNLSISVIGQLRRCQWQSSAKRKIWMRRFRNRRLAFIDLLCHRRFVG